jgi:hypothetical protein
MPGVAPAQDTVPALRHVLSFDTSRLQPYRRVYEMLVLSGDSAFLIGQREVALSEARYAGRSVWLIVESRTGAVPSIDSLFVAPDVTPVHWSSTIGPARLALEFVGDTLYGASYVAGTRQNIVLNGRPDLLASGSMVETVLGLLPLTASWSDSAAALHVEATTARITPSELLVVSEDDVPTDSSTLRPAWVVALRSEGGNRQVMYWVDKETGAPLRVLQALPAHVGAMLEYRLLPTLTQVPPPEQPRTRN